MRSDTTNSTDLEKNEFPHEPHIASQPHVDDGDNATATKDDHVHDIDAPPLPQEAQYSVYTQREKLLTVAGGAIGAIFSALTVQIYMPTLNQLADSFDVSVSRVNLTVTSYMILQGLTPMLVGGFSDRMGRRPAYIICFIVYIAANIGLAACDSYAALLGLRCLQAAGVAATQTLCQAVVADITTSAERGHYIGIITLPSVLGTSAGPLIGGAMAQYLGWRSIFWLLAILGGVTLLGLFLFFPESCRTIVGDGSVRPPRLYDTPWQLLRASCHGGSGTMPTSTPNDESREVAVRNSPRLGAKTVFASFILLNNLEFGFLLAYGALMFASIYAYATALPSQMAQVYGYDSFQIGLMYLPMVGGTIVAVGFVGKVMNWNYARHAIGMGLPPVDRSKQTDLSDFPIERARLEIAVPLVLLTSVITMGWGWALESRTSVAVPCVLLFVLGISYIGVINIINALISDCYREMAATAVAANWFVRCMVGAAMSAAISPLIDAIGVGWAYTIIGVLIILFSPLIFVIMWKGLQWRQERALKERRNEETRGEAGDGIVANGVD